MKYFYSKSKMFSDAYRTMTVIFLHSTWCFNSRHMRLRRLKTWNAHSCEKNPKFFPGLRSFKSMVRHWHTACEQWCSMGLAFQMLCSRLQSRCTLASILFNFHVCAHIIFKSSRRTFRCAAICSIVSRCIYHQQYHFGCLLQMFITNAGTWLMLKSWETTKRLLLFSFWVERAVALPCHGRFCFLYGDPCFHTPWLFPHSCLAAYGFTTHETSCTASSSCASIGLQSSTLEPQRGTHGAWFLVCVFAGGGESRSPVLSGPDDRVIPALRVSVPAPDGPQVRGQHRAGASGKRELWWRERAPRNRSGGHVRSGWRVQRDRPQVDPRSEGESLFSECTRQCRLACPLINVYVHVFQDRCRRRTRCGNHCESGFCAVSTPVC